MAKKQTAKKRGKPEPINDSHKRVVKAAPTGAAASKKEEQASAAQPLKPKKIYKYIGPDGIEKVFHSANVGTLKCSLPKEFNDPYELFLTINFNERPDALAFYADAIGELPQFPTTCFSRSPIVLPMWAHYARNLEGFAVDFFWKIDSTRPFRRAFLAT